MKFDITHLLKPACYSHPVSQIKLIETHISWVILTGEFAYKIKKPVNFGFLDFSTLDKRRECCEQELRLNRRLAPEIYLDVVEITGSFDDPVISGQADVIEYAVKMLQFAQQAQLDHMLAAGRLTARHMEAIAHMVADFHRSVEVATESMPYGNSDVVYQPVEENFVQIRQHIDTAPYADTLDSLQHWSRSEFTRLEYVLNQRKRDGYVRECHGDMHLRNLLWLEHGALNQSIDRPVAFDCIEFNAQLRWIDVISEIAFLVMDLHDRQQHLLANRFLNTYLESSGDYEGLSVLPFYFCYRALVRAKVDALRLEQKNLDAAEQQASRREFESYLTLAMDSTQRPTPRMILMRGVSASGKSTVSRQLVDALGAVRIRSDVERKRLFNLAADHAGANAIDSGIYSAQASDKTYAKLAELAATIITAGYSVIVDAAFLKHEQRAPFQSLARDCGIAFTIVEVTAPAEILRKRISARVNDVSDADLAVLEHQLANWQALRDDERDVAISVDTTDSGAVTQAIDLVASRSKTGFV
ncbi:MAG: AAA family ATPase [Gammaproteobacteria bacterium]